jgi:tetratricopeptide (TPR) repeat protein
MLRLPAWYDEGLAQLASTLVIRSGRTEIGVLRPDHVQLLRERTWVPVGKVLSAQDLSRWSRLEREMFRAESWAIAHLIRVGEMRRRQSRELITDYLDLVAKGQSLADAANRVLGDEFAGALRTHVNSAVMDSISVRQFKEAPRFESRALTSKEILEELGGLALALARVDTARRYFAAALSLEAQSARSHSGRASADALDQLLDEAELRFATALEIAPLDPLIHLARANALSAAARVSTDPERARLVGLARGAYERSLILADTIPETHAMLAASYLIDGQDVADGVVHVNRASALLPASLDIQLMRARLELRRGNSGIARAIAIQVLSRARITSTIDAAGILLNEIDARLARH